jgi:hypothetical protein
MQAQTLLVLFLFIAELKTDPKFFLVETNSTGRKILFQKLDRTICKHLLINIIVPQELHKKGAQV